MGTKVTMRGPFLEGDAPKEIERFLDDAEKVVAEEGLQMLRSNLQPRLQHPTGRYMRSLDVVQTGSRFEVTDGGIVYGPWLEGTGRRNARSRFKGYQHWRRTRQQLQQRVVQIAERVLPQHLERLK